MIFIIDKFFNFSTNTKEVMPKDIIIDFFKWSKCGFQLEKKNTKALKIYISNYARKIIRSSRGRNRIWGHYIIYGKIFALLDQEKGKNKLGYLNVRTKQSIYLKYMNSGFVKSDLDGSNEWMIADWCNYACVDIQSLLKRLKMSA